MERYFSLKSFIVTMKSIINKFIAPYFCHCCVSVLEQQMGEIIFPAQIADGLSRN